MALWMSRSFRTWPAAMAHANVGARMLWPLRCRVYRTDSGRWAVLAVAPRVQ